jgi:hypothetical protein
VLPRNFEHIAGARRTDIQGLDRMFQVIHRAGERGQMKYAVDLAIQMQGLGNVVFDKVKGWIREKMLNVFPMAGDQIIYADDRVTSLYQAIAQMRADEACGSGNQVTQSRAPFSLFRDQDSGVTETSHYYCIGTADWAHSLRS